MNSSIIAIGHSFRSLFRFNKPHHQLENFVACHSISVWTVVDTKIPFSTLLKTQLLCALCSTSIYWRCLAVKFPLNWVTMLAGANGAELFTSLIVSAVNGREFNIASHSTITVCKDSVSKHLPWLLSKPLSIAQAGRICLSQIPPKWFALGGFFFQTM